MPKIKIEQITIGGNRRKLGDIAELAKSIDELGLINPVQVNEELVLIAGLHRIEACKSLGWSEIEAAVLSVTDITAERIEIAENLFRAELTTLERGNQYKRLKELYEAEFPQTKSGMRNGQTSKKTESVFLETPSFIKDTATKTNKSATTIQEDVQVATNISEEVQAVIKELPIADRKTDLLKLSRLNETAQKEVAGVLVSGKAETYEEAVNVLQKDFEKSQPKPSKEMKTRNYLGGIVDKIYEAIHFAKTEKTIEIVVKKFDQRALNAHYTNFTRLRDKLNEWIAVLERQGAELNDTQERVTENQDNAAATSA